MEVFRELGLADRVYEAARDLAVHDTREPVLRSEAVDAGADVRFGTALTSLDQTTDMIGAWLSDGELQPHGAGRGRLSR